jgi:hypothetical protein
VGWDVGIQGVQWFPMKDAGQLRNRATRLLTLALKARDDGHHQYADELTQFASEAFDQATDMERRVAPNPGTQPQQPAQQQQQPQPKKE